MNRSVVEVHVRAIIPTSAGHAIFIGNDQKNFIIYVDEHIGTTIAMLINQIPKERPLTHDLIGHLLAALGAKVERIIINDLKSATYFARIILSAENELQQHKIIELDARPSDSIALAVQQHAPIYVSREVWDEVDDMSEVLRQMRQNLTEPKPDDGDDESSAGDEKKDA